MTRLGSVTALALLAAPAPALAQAYQCALPEGRISIPDPARGAPVRTRIAGYTLAASWSPEYCRSRAASVGDTRQCSGRHGRFGMILHGLWPEGSARSPQWCGQLSAPSEADVRPMMCLTPSARLLAHEWARHGSCMARRPATYFRIARILWGAVRWPDFDRLSRGQGLTAGDVRRAFADANPSWQPDDVGLEVNRRGWLEGVRLCYGLDFLPRPCRGDRFGPADEAKVSIWRGL